ncbi:hypothetical protein FRB94_012836 [Tulasnella sp. JGI-2019a]|nr:hypothetical protein FRB94_012836 [Tulasnella sp. JGI-2019a]KAG9016395.1 hypothetical protein FRB93_010644 [Tulasnella sp. JGI-2019a]
MSTPPLDSDLDRHRSESPEEDHKAWVANVLKELGTSYTGDTTSDDATILPDPGASLLESDPRPSCRLIVTASEALLVQSVAIVDVYDTVLLGRDRQPSPHIRLKEMMVSKHHAYIFWDSDNSTWAIVDNGSVHGTFVSLGRDISTTPTRLSPARTASLPRPLQHEDQIHIGSTTFVIHIHQHGHLCSTCDAVTIGEKPLVAESLGKEERPTVADRSGESVTQEKEDPKATMQRLRKNLLSRPTYQPTSSKRSLSSTQASTSENSTYVDRAKKRRLLNIDYGLQGLETPPDSPGESSSGGTPTYPARRYHRTMSVQRQAEVLGESFPTPSHQPPSHLSSGTNTPIAAIPLDANNVGHKLLMKQGWQQGTALGDADEPDRSALVEPLQVRMLQHRAGLGSHSASGAR